MSAGVKRVAKGRSISSETRGLAGGGKTSAIIAKRICWVTRQSPRARCACSLFTPSALATAPRLHESKRDWLRARYKVSIAVTFSRVRPQCPNSLLRKPKSNGALWATMTPPRRSASTRSMTSSKRGASFNICSVIRLTRNAPAEIARWGSIRVERVLSGAPGSWRMRAISQTRSPAFGDNPVVSTSTNVSGTSVILRA